MLDFKQIVPTSYGSNFIAASILDLKNPSSPLLKYVSLPYRSILRQFYGLWGNGSYHHLPQYIFKVGEWSLWVEQCDSRRPSASSSRGGSSEWNNNKLDRPVFWTKFVHNVAMDLAQRLFEVTLLEPIGVNAVKVRIYLFGGSKSDLIWVPHPLIQTFGPKF